MSLKIIETGTIRKLGYGFLFAFYSNYGSILHHVRDKAINWSKIATFWYPLYSTPPLGRRGGGRRRNIAIPFGTEKLEWCGCPAVKKFCATVLTEYRHVMDRQTDGRTSCSGISALYITSRGETEHNVLRSLQFYKTFGKMRKMRM